MKTTQQTLRILKASLVCLLAIGCGSGVKPPEMVSVKGKVLAADGTPLRGGSIFFHPDASNSFQDDKPSSILQTDGTFTMKTFPFGEGIPPGKYKVTLADETATRVKAPKFARATSTPWEIDVPDTGITEQVFKIQ